MSISPLNAAISGLRAAQAQISVTSHNIANATTDGYSRKLLNQYSTVVNGEGNGVSTGVIQRRIDQILVRDYRAQISSTASLQVKKTYMSQIQEMYGPPNAEYSISSTIGKLQNAFSQLANQPEDAYLLTNVYNKATQLVGQFQQYSSQIVQMRNNAQDEMSQSVTRVNQLTERIAELNRNIKSATAVGRTTADLEDHRDLAVRQLSEELDISYFVDNTNSMIVMTKNGHLLADSQAVKMQFSPNPQGALTYYPVSAAGIILGDPILGTDVTSEKALGGKLGALVSLRDETLPTYMAQLDELAQKTAMRLSSQGLNLFTQRDGTVPLNNPVTYAGFSTTIVVNPAIQIDHSLIRTGTNPGASTNVQTGSSELLNKVVQYGFGNVQYEEITGAVDISNTADTLFNILGLQAQARLMGTVNLDGIGPFGDLLGIDNTNPSDFNIQIGANPPVNITVNPTDGISNLVSTINAATGIPGFASIGPGGQLILTASEDISITTGSIGVIGLRSLGLDAATTPAQNPTFEITTGNSYPTSVTIAPTDTATDLLAKLNAISGVTAHLTPDGYLQVQPTQGGSIAFVDKYGNPLAAMNVTQSAVAHDPFNVTGLGPGGNLNGRIQTGTTLHDYATQMIGTQSQEAANIDAGFTAESSYMNTIRKNFLDSTGVNIDEEMASLITIQMAYTASARAISAVEAMMDELMNTFR